MITLPTYLLLWCWTLRQVYHFWLGSIQNQVSLFISLLTRIPLITLLADFSISIESNFLSFMMAPDPTSGAGSSTSVPSIMAGHDIGSGDDIGAIRSILSSYSKSSGVAGMQSESMAVIPSKVELQSKPLVVKKPGKMWPGKTLMARYGWLFWNP